MFKSLVGVGRTWRRFVWATGVAAGLCAAPAWGVENADVVCIQHTLYGLGYQPGPPDGRVEAATKKASAAYLRDHPGSPLPDLTQANSDIWCKGLRKTHQQTYLSNLPFWREARFAWGSNVWLGWVAGGTRFRLVGDLRDPALRHLVFYLPDAGNKAESGTNECSRIFRTLPARAILVCPTLSVSATGPDRRSDKSVTRLRETVRRLKRVFIGAKLHCAGLGSGGHNCLAITQARDAAFDCVVAAAPALNSVEDTDVTGRVILTNAPDEYDPTTAVAKTAAQRVIVLGDPRPGGDKTVSRHGWEAFVEAAHDLSLPVTYARYPGQGHNLSSAMLSELSGCLER